MNREQELKENLAKVRNAIRTACKTAGRNESEIRLVGASKTKSWMDVDALFRAGLKDFGENYVQEAIEKKNKVPNAHWHFIGTLQSNKAKFIPGNFVLFHGLHSLTVAKKIEQGASELKIVQNCLVEVNINNEASKGGAILGELPSLLSSLSEFKHINIQGLMCIPDPNQPARKAYWQMCALLEEANQSGWYRTKMTELSMGMSHDFTDAILEGATIVRVGTALFGARETK